MTAVSTPERHAQGTRRDTASQGRFLWVAASLFVAAAGGIRMALVMLGWPELNSDEATMGLMARHIALDTDHPIFFYGQRYMGALEAYLAAPLMRWFGAGTVALRVPSVLLFAVFLIVLFTLARRLYGPGVALLSLCILVLGPEELLFRQIEAVGGFQESLVVVGALLLLAIRLTLEEVPRRGRWAWYGACGLCAGVGLWSDPLVVPWVAAGAWLLLPHWRTWRNAAMALAGTVLGLMPVIVHDLTDPGHSAVGAVFQAFTHAGAGHSTGILTRILGLLAVAVPVVTGARPVCGIAPTQAWPFELNARSHVGICSSVHLGWGGAFALLWLAGGLVCWRSWRSACTEGERAVARCRLALWGAGSLTLLLYLAGGASAIQPRYTARYLSLLLLDVPLVVGLVAALPTQVPVRLRTMTRALSILAMAGYVAVLAAGTVQTFGAVAVVQAENARQETLVRSLDRLRVTRLRTDYWTCDRLVFQSGEQIVCAVVNADLRGRLGSSCGM